MQKKVIQSPNQIVQEQSSVGNLPQQVVEFFQCRIETQQNYAKALQKLNNKFPGIENQTTESSKVLKHLKAIHSQKYHQTIQFINELRSQTNNFQNAIQKNNEELQKSGSQVKVQQANLKNVIQKIHKIQAKGQQEIKVLDQKFILKQLTLLNISYKNKKIQQSLKILQEQNKICLNLKNEYEQLKIQGQKLVKKIKKHEKIILQNSPQIQGQIIDLVKKYTVQEVSLIRNMQYDIDNMIKKTNIFDEPTSLQPEKQKMKAPKNGLVKTAKDIFKNQFKIKDVFHQTKKMIANLTQNTLKEMGLKNSIQKSQKEKVQKQIQNWNANKNVNNLLVLLSQNQVNKSKEITIQFIQSFRNKNVNKFPQKQFVQLCKLFNVIMTKAIQQKDFTTIQKLIVYGSCYTCTNQTDKLNINQTMIDAFTKNESLTDPCFWKFLLYFVILRSAIEYLEIENQKEIHLKNNVFSALVSNSLIMIGCGIDKYLTKNTVAKMAKSFGLADNQVGDLLKFIQNGYQKYEKEKKKI